MKLIVAEKPSVAQAIASLLGITEKHNGCLQGCGYIITWCIGHLVELAPADAYDEKYAQWRYENLPIIPKSWKFIVPEEKLKQYKVVSRLLNDPGVSEVICATDAGREGELIFRLVYRKSGCKKPVKRLWISSMEDDAIRQGLSNMKPMQYYDSLYQAAISRAQADWLVGINATRLFSILYRQTLPIGRVMTPTLAMIVKRESDIKGSKSKPFYTVNLQFEKLCASSEKQDCLADAKRIKASCHQQPVAISEIKHQEKSVSPPRLFDLTTLQREANRHLGFTAQQTLDYAQSLYEKKLITYPRTDSRYLSLDQSESVKKLIPAIASMLSFESHASAESDITNLIRDEAVSDHHAIIPTPFISQTEILSLPRGEQNILTMIMVQLICSVGKPHRYLESKAVLLCAGHTFTASEKRTVEEGWQTVYLAYLVTLGKTKEQETSAADLSDLQTKQQLLPSDITIKEGKTSPPKRYSEDLLLSAMEKAGRKELAVDVLHQGLGTPATRAGIIEKLIRTGLISRQGSKQKKTLSPTHKGISLITVMPDIISSPQLTTQWENRLYLIEKGEEDSLLFLQETAQMINELISSYQAVKDEHFSSTADDTANVIGTCPRCGEPVIEKEKFFAASGQIVVSRSGRITHFSAAKEKG